MADEQTPHSDLIDDAIRQAERQLEEKLEALRMSALGEPTPSTPPVQDAALHPSTDVPVAGAHEAEHVAPQGDNDPAGAIWQEVPGSDLSFAPADADASPSPASPTSAVPVDEPEPAPDAALEPQYRDASLSQPAPRYEDGPAVEAPAPLHQPVQPYQPIGAHDELEAPVDAGVADTVYVPTHLDEARYEPPAVDLPLSTYEPSIHELQGAHVPGVATPAVETSGRDGEPATAWSEAESVEQVDPSTLRAATSWDIEPDYAEPDGYPSDSMQDESSWDHPEPVHASWTSRQGPEHSPGWNPGARDNSFDGTPSAMISIPTEEELQFWAHTRTALRNIQVSTDLVPSAVLQDIGMEIGQVMRDELAPMESVIGRVHDDAARELPKLADRVEHVADTATDAAAAAHAAGTSINELRTELPAQLSTVVDAVHLTVRADVERAAQATREQVHAHVDAAATSLHGAIQQDVGRIEESIATNVTRMAVGVTDSVARVEVDLDRLGESISRFERGVGTGFDRVEKHLRTSIDRAEQSLGAKLDSPARSLKKLEDELPAHLDRVETALTEQVQGGHRELLGTLTSLVDANRASLDRVAAISSTLDEERTRRTEDVATIVDTVTIGWEGLAGAVKALYEQHAGTAQRIEAIEDRLNQLRDLESAVETTMNDLREVVSNLTPAPIVVTVAHSDAEIRNETRSGWTPSNGSSEPRPAR